MTHFRIAAPLLATALGIAACSVSTDREDNGARTYDIKADIGGVKADIDTGNGGNVSVDGDRTRVELGNGAFHATVRTDDNRSVTVSSNQQ